MIGEKKEQDSETIGDILRISERRKKILIRWVAFQDGYVPSKIVYRNAQIEKLKGFMEDVLVFGERGIVSIYGNTGTGKTVTVRKVTNLMENMARMEKVNIKLKIIWATAGGGMTPFKIINRLTYNMGLTKKEYVRGYALEELFSLIADYIRKMSYDHYLFVLDDLHKLKTTEKDGPLGFLNFFIRFNYLYPDIAKRKKVSAIFISRENTQHLAGYDNVGIFNYAIYFPPYDEREIEDILKIHLRDAEAERFIDDYPLSYLSAWTYNNEAGNVRIALKILEKALKNVIKKGEEKITKEDITQSIALATIEDIKKDLIHLPFSEVLILVLIARHKIIKNEPVKSPELFSMFNHIYSNIFNYKEFSIRTFERHIENLKYGGYIDATSRSYWKKGRYYEIDLHRPLHLIEALYELKNDSLSVGGNEFIDPSILINDSEDGNPLIIYDPIRKRLRALKSARKDYGERVITTYSPWVIPSW